MPEKKNTANNASWRQRLEQLQNLLLGQHSLPEKSEARLEAEENCDALCDAINAADPERLKTLLQAGIPPDACYENNRYTPLMHALHQRLLKDPVPYMQQLVKHGANIEHTDSDGLTALDWAVKTGRTNAALWLLDNGAVYAEREKPIGFYNPPRQHASPLEKTIQCGYRDVAAALLRYGVPVADRDITLAAAFPRSRVAFMVLRSLSLALGAREISDSEADLFESARMIQRHAMDGAVMDVRFRKSGDLVHGTDKEYTTLQEIVSGMAASADPSTKLRGRLLHHVLESTRRREGLRQEDFSAWTYLLRNAEQAPGGRPWDVDAIEYFSLQAEPDKKKASPFFSGLVQERDEEAVLPLVNMMPALLLVDPGTGENLLHAAAHAAHPVAVRYILHKAMQAVDPWREVMFPRNEYAASLLFRFATARDDDGNTPMHAAMMSQNPEVVDALLENIQKFEKFGYPENAYNVRNKKGLTPYGVALMTEDDKNPKIIRTFIRQLWERGIRPESKDLLQHPSGAAPITLPVGQAAKQALVDCYLACDVPIPEHVFRFIAPQEPTSHRDRVSAKPDASSGKDAGPSQNR